MCCTWLAGNTGRKNCTKISPSAHHCATLLGYIFATKPCIDNQKKFVKQQYLLQTSPQYGKFWPTDGWDWFRSLEHPSKFQRVSRSWFHYCSDVAHWRPTKLYTMFGRLLGWYTIYTFSGAFASWRNIAMCKIHLVSQVLHSPIFAALLHSTAAARSAKVCRIEQREPPIFGRAAITLGIGPHSSLSSVG